MKSSSQSTDAELARRERIEEYEDCMRCPECGYTPLQHAGERTLALKFKNAKIYCPNCMYEDNL